MEAESMNIYQDGSYVKKHPTWHTEDSPWKADQIMKIIRRNELAPKSVCEIGCGAGEILNQLYNRMPDEVEFFGYEISPQAFELCRTREKQRLNFHLKDVRDVPGIYYDLMLVIDVFEHVEDCFGFLRDLRLLSKYKIFHIPLDISAYTAVSKTLIRARESMGHIHYYTKDTALATLKDTGYKVIDSFYTWGALTLPLPPGSSIARRALKLSRRALYTFNQNAASRLLGGASLLVLAECSGRD